MSGELCQLLKRGKQQSWERKRYKARVLSCYVKFEMIITLLSEISSSWSRWSVQRLKGLNGFSDRHFNLWNSSYGGDRNKQQRSFEEPSEH